MLTNIITHLNMETGCFDQVQSTYLYFTIELGKLGVYTKDGKECTYFTA